MVHCSISSSSSSRITNAFRTNIKDKNDFSIKTITGVAAAITTSTFTVSDGIAGDKIVAFQRVSTIRRMSMMSMLQSNTVASVRVQPNCYQLYRTTISLNRIRIRKINNRIVNHKALYHCQDKVNHYYPCHLQNVVFCFNHPQLGSVQRRRHHHHMVICKDL